MIMNEGEHEMSLRMICICSSNACCWRINILIQFWKTKFRIREEATRNSGPAPANFNSLQMEYVGVGSIKKIFGRQREPYGFVTITQPPEAKGMEAVFYLKVITISTTIIIDSLDIGCKMSVSLFEDVLVSEDERRLLQGGLIVRFAFSRKPLDRMKAPCPFKATQVITSSSNKHPLPKTDYRMMQEKSSL